ncbi:MAG: hypothetical protein LBP34_00385 [Flavobacteriaceae bacterium]|jgi:hypothetical protein|nr:hypothetical protein [Flavobacteriaceae bacterium]
MYNDRIIQLLNNPENIRFSDKHCIEYAFTQYPYVQSFQILNLKWKQFFTPEEIEKEIEKVSVYSTHRELIKTFLEQPGTAEKPEITQEREEEPAQNETTETENVVIPEEIHKPEEIEEISNDITETKKEEKAESVEIPEDISVKEVSNVDFSSKEQKNKKDDYFYMNKLGISHLFNDTIVEDVQKQEENIEQAIEDETEPAIVEEKQSELSGEIENTEKISEEEEPKEEENDTEEGKKEESVEEPVLEQKETMEETVVTPVERMTFNQWISLSKQKVAVKYEKKIPTQEKQNDIITKFIENNPKITVPKKEEKDTKGIEFKKEDIRDIASLMTVTLAQLYVEQGKYETAITAFKILSLKYPEKSSYFASEVKKIKKIKNLK